MRKPDVCPVFLLGGAYGKENLLCAPFFRKIGAPEKENFVYAQLVYIIHTRRLKAGHEQELFLRNTPQDTSQGLHNINNRTKHKQSTTSLKKKNQRIVQILLQNHKKCLKMMTKW